MNAARVAVAVVAALHVWFMIFEMVLWTSPFALESLGMSLQVATDSAVLAFNQGAYNGVLASGLLISLWATPEVSRAFQVFFLGAIVVMGIIGGLTASASILVIQALPAAIALALVLRAG
ncbi:MAG: putative membrane protein [Myxococcota bacterium]|jgi:putative membrane protein